MAKQFQLPIKRSPAKDPQQYLVYRMENEAIGARRYTQLSRKAIARLIRSICREYKLPKVNVQFADLGDWTAQWDAPATITFGKKASAKSILTITHEMAHHLHYHLAGIESFKHEDHGAEFMACHMSILDTARVIPVVGMRAICEAYKIQYADPGTKNSLTALKRAVLGYGQNRSA